MFDANRLNLDAFVFPATLAIFFIVLSLCTAVSGFLFLKFRCGRRNILFLFGFLAIQVPLYFLVFWALSGSQAGLILMLTAAVCSELLLLYGERKRRQGK